MCGISGIISKEFMPKNELGLILNSLKNNLNHRGPDDYGEHIGNNCGFMNCRLSIIDIKHGKQPIYNSNKTCGIVYNGEVYNYKELQSEAISKGYKFYTDSDTETVLKTYEMHGENSFSKFNGMFAFCIWDTNKDCIYLVRDCFGIKPLYIYEDKKRIIFSSEIQAILKIPGLDLTYDPMGFQDYFCFRYIQAPYTLYKNIRKLEAGNYIKIKNGKCHQHTFSNLEYNVTYPYIRKDEAAELLLSTLEETVKSQLVGEVPIAISLSGGIDSSIISYMVKKCGVNLKTFNIGFPEDNEFEYSKIVANSLGLDHVEVVVEIKDLINDFDEVIRKQDEPLSDAACFPLYRLSKEIKKHATVVLSGEGGDELFGGYPQYIPFVTSNNTLMDKFTLFLRDSQYHINHKDFMKNKELTSSFDRNIKHFKKFEALNGLLHYDIKTWVPDDLMMKADKTLMAHSLEGRFPFLDKRMFELAAKLPVEYKIVNNETKFILKYACSSILPDTIIRRPKKGFSVPISKLLFEMKDKVIDTFECAKKSSISEIIDMNVFNTMINTYYSGSLHLSLRVWNAFILFSKVIL